MVKYQLVWSGYIQWTRAYPSDAEAVEAARKWIGNEKLSDFVLLKMFPIPLE